MSKINAFITVPVMELTEIVAKCGAVVGATTQLISKYYTEPTEEDISQDSEAEASAEPKQEASFEDGFLQGLGVKQHPNKPIVLVTE